MRRSAAPSFRTDVKRARFLPQIIKNISLNNKENTTTLVTSHENNCCDAKNTATSSTSTHLSDLSDERNTSCEKVRSDKDVLDLIFEEDSTAAEDKTCNNSISSTPENINNNNCVQNTKVSSNIKTPAKRNNFAHPPKYVNKEETNKSCIFCLKDLEEASLFNVVWCKRSGKKHKKWEGDGFLIVRTRSAILKDLNGKTLDKGLGYKLKETESLDEGSNFFIGGKECEIQCKVSDEECQSGKYCNCNAVSESPTKQPEKPDAKINKPC